MAFIKYLRVMVNNKGKRTEKTANGAVEHFEMKDDKITKSKETVGENLQQTLNQTKEEKEDRAFRLISLIFREAEEKVDKYVEKIEKMLLRESLSSEEEESLKGYLLENSSILRRIPTFIRFFKDWNLLNRLSFEAVYKLLSLNLTNQQLNNLILMADVSCQRDVGVNKILEGISDNKILSNSAIVYNVVELGTIEQDYEQADYLLSMDLDVKDYILLGDIVLSEGLIEKIRLLIELKVYFSIKDFEALDKFEIDETMINKLKNLENKVYIYFADLPIIQEMNIDENLLKKIDKIDKLYEWRFNAEQLPRIQKLSEIDIQKLEYIETKLGEKLNYTNFDLICNLERCEIDKII